MSDVNFFFISFCKAEKAGSAACGVLAFDH